jgi:hypothetical protein
MAAATAKTSMITTAATTGLISALVSNFVIRITSLTLAVHPHQSEYTTSKNACQVLK